jgi:Cu+-exporting ATPase
MTCGACTSAVEGGFKNVDGIASFTVSLITERAVAVHDPNVIPAEKVVEM